MAKTDVKLYSTDTYGKVTTTTVSDVNPDAPNNQLVQMGRLFNNLTQNTYGKTDRINTINCDTEGGNRQTATITLQNTSVSKADFESAIQNGYGYNGIVFTYNGDGQPYAIISSTQCGVSAMRGSSGNTHFAVFVSRDSSGAMPTLAYPFTVTVRADETDNYTAAAPKVFTVNA